MWWQYVLLYMSDSIEKLDTFVYDYLQMRFQPLYVVYIQLGLETCTRVTV